METVDTRNGRRWWILAVLCLSVLLTVVDNTIVNVALPSISRDLHASTGDLPGRRRLLQLGLALFALFSVGAALAQNTGELIAARAAMGAAAALVYPATLAILNSVVTNPRDRATAIEVWAAGSGLAVAIGPVVGGALLVHFDWSSVFYVSVPVAVVALIGGRLLLPEARDPEAGRFDPFGALLSIVGIALLTWSIIEAPSHGWGSAATVGGIGGALVVLAVFAWGQARGAEPVLALPAGREPP